ncbi:NAD(P)/FAD-dependent oxidoreductase [Psychrobacter sp. N25K4-3-2]|uniref:NAD(P)-binding protein n=1 Tax=Psychrobacter sp. N25K4-3-2 TaxID=2785026 RepID=UPI00188C8202|nr:NAD(P)-binding protein [Psychrobacter sp. N25K4-3-2]MBF4488376.1 NAD(P)/FAD-dependent oxidoreductase [Psychrobacter sp. N25K4-3-2]
MSIQQLETDYLIIGSGAVGMAFADVLLTETDANIIIVDKQHKPGGHWNDAYSFVTLHQPSSFYGVSSRELCGGMIDKIGLNKGLSELASGAEVMAYFDKVMKHTFLPSGRVKYFPMCEYQGNGKFSSLLSDTSYEVKVNKKIIDGTYFKTSVPATHTPNFEIADGVKFGPLNDLPNLTTSHSGYVIVGGGKTGIDAILWLLENHINPDHITWIMPRDAWLINRQNTQPSRDFFTHTIGAQATQAEAIADAENIEDLFDRLEKGGVLMRIDPNVRPQMFHGATISSEELTQLRRVKNIVRKGRVTRLDTDKIYFGDDSIATTPNTMHIDCSARAVPVTETYDVFKGKTVVVQTVRTYQPVFSAAFIAHIEASYDDETVKNELCQVVPIPNHDTDFLVGLVKQMQNQMRWSKEPALREWMINNRLDGFTKLVRASEDTPPEELAILKRLKEAGPKAAANMPKLMGEIMQITAARHANTANA